MADSFWLPAAPFRSWAKYLMRSCGVGADELAACAGVPAAAVRTLVYGRGGLARPHVARAVAERLTDLTVSDLANRRTA